MRVRTTDQRFDLQRDAIEQAAKAVGDMVDTWCEEKASGRSNASRPVWREVFAWIEAGEVERLYVYSLDRCGRSLGGIVEAIEACEAARTQLVSVKQKIDTTSTFGRMFVRICALFAEWERELIEERTREGLRQARCRGARFGRPAILWTETLDRQIAERIAAGLRPEQFDGVLLARWSHGRAHTLRLSARQIRDRLLELRAQRPDDAPRLTVKPEDPVQRKGRWLHFCYAGRARMKMPALEQAILAGVREVTRADGVKVPLPGALVSYVLEKSNTSVDPCPPGDVESAPA